MSFKLIPEWKKAHKYWSVRLNGLALAVMSLSEGVSQTWQNMPSDLKSMVPYASTVATSLFVLGLVARFIDQPGLKNADTDTSN